MDSGIILFIRKPIEAEVYKYAAATPGVISTEGKGLDSQYLMALGTPEEVREEVKHLMETYKRQDGRLRKR